MYDLGCADAAPLLPTSPGAVITLNRGDDARTKPAEVLRYRQVYLAPSAPVVRQRFCVLAVVPLSPGRTRVGASREPDAMRRLV
jgi:hypothetical protein